MGKGKTVVLGSLCILMLIGQSIAVADKEGLSPHPAAIPNVNLGLTAIPNMRNPVGLPAGARVGGPGATPLGGSGPGKSVGNGSSVQMAAPSAVRSISASGLTPPGHTSGTSPDQLPTCR